MSSDDGGASLGCRRSSEISQGAVPNQHPEAAVGAGHKRAHSLARTLSVLCDPVGAAGASKSRKAFPLASHLEGDHDHWTGLGQLTFHLGLTTSSHRHPPITLTP